MLKSKFHDHITLLIVIGVQTIQSEPIFSENLIRYWSTCKDNLPKLYRKKGWQVKTIDGTTNPISISGPDHLSRNVKLTMAYQFKLLHLTVLKRMIEFVLQQKVAYIK